jgi:hypothetical protein
VQRGVGFLGTGKARHNEAQRRAALSR